MTATIRSTVVDSPIGELLLLATDTGIVRIAFACEDGDAVLGETAEALSGEVVPLASEDLGGAEGGAAAHLATASAALTRYFSGADCLGEVPVDPALAGGFRGRAQAALADIPFGETRTYAQLASELGKPGAARALGSACASNPLPLLWPCHRVLRTDGSLGGFRGGLIAKRLLLDLERAAVES